jgi:hypothetical protein
LKKLFESLFWDLEQRPVLRPIHIDVGQFRRLIKEPLTSTLVMYRSGLGLRVLARNPKGVSIIKNVYSLYHGIFM